MRGDPGGVGERGEVGGVVWGEEFAGGSGGGANRGPRREEESMGFLRYTWTSPGLVEVHICGGCCALVTPDPSGRRVETDIARGFIHSG